MNIMTKGKVAHKCTLCITQRMKKDSIGFNEGIDDCRREHTHGTITENQNTEHEVNSKHERSASVTGSSLAGTSLLPSNSAPLSSNSTNNASTNLNRSGSWPGSSYTIHEIPSGHRSFAQTNQAPAEKSKTKKDFFMRK